MDECLRVLRREAKYPMVDIREEYSDSKDFFTVYFSTITNGWNDVWELNKEKSKSKDNEELSENTRRNVS